MEANCFMQDILKDIMKQLKKELDKSRYEHTLGVMYTAASLAMAHSQDIEKAMLAGLLHDCAKCIPNDKKVALCKKNSIELTQAEESSPFLIHAKLGAFLAREKYQIEDEAILHAIKVHTTGEPHMSMLDEIIYIADYIEPGRDKAQNLSHIRKVSFENLDEAMLLILKDTLKYLEQTSESIDIITKETYEYFLRKEENI